MTPFNTTREIPATVEQVFAAISNPELSRDSKTLGYGSGYPLNLAIY